MFFNLDVQERHSTLKSDPKSMLQYLWPKNEEAEKEKFKHLTPKTPIVLS